MRAAFVWIGAILFPVSLISFLVVYGIILDQPGPAGTPMAEAAIIDVALFSMFALHHSALARTGARAWISRSVSPQLERSVYVWIASLLFLAVCLLWRPLPGLAWTVEQPVAVWTLRLIQFVGLSLTLRAAAIVDIFELNGVNQFHQRVRPVEFKVQGPFGLVRHPIYLGWVLIVFGPTRMTMSRLLFAVISSAYLLIAIPWEERSLVEAFGDRYRAYQQQVRSRIFPGLW